MSRPQGNPPVDTSTDGAPKFGMTPSSPSRCAVSEHFKCSICFALLYQPITLPCGHTICLEHTVSHRSYTDATGKIRSCPECRADTCGITYYTNIAMTNVITALFPEEYKQREAEYKQMVHEKTRVKLYKGSVRYDHIYKLLLEKINRYVVCSYAELFFTVHAWNLLWQERLKGTPYPQFKPVSEEEVMIVLAHFGNTSIAMEYTQNFVVTNKVYSPNAIKYIYSYACRQADYVGSHLEIDKMTGLPFIKKTNTYAIPHEEISKHYADVCRFRDQRIIEFSTLRDSDMHNITHDYMLSTMRSMEEITSNDFIYKYTRDLGVDDLSMKSAVEYHHEYEIYSPPPIFEDEDLFADESTSAIEEEDELE